MRLPPAGPDWRWLSFPVFAAAVFGALIASFLDRPDTDFAVGVRVLLVILSAYCIAHVFTAYVVAPRLAARRRAAAAPSKPKRDRYEEELVYKDEPSTRKPGR